MSGNVKISGRVRSTEEARNLFRTRAEAPESGELVGMGRQAGTVRVLIDGQVSPNTYDARFWEDDE